LSESILVCFWEVLELSLLLVGGVKVENTRPKWQTVVFRLVYTCGLTHMAIRHGGDDVDFCRSS
jgi:hypothetical protein